MTKVLRGFIYSVLVIVVAFAATVALGRNSGDAVAPVVESHLEAQSPLPLKEEGHTEETFTEKRSSFEDELSKLSKDEEALLTGTKRIQSALDNDKETEPSESPDEGKLQQAIQDELTKLAHSDTPSQAPAALTKEPSSVITTEKAPEDLKLQEILDQKRVLEEQQERLMNQIVIYRNELRDLRANEKRAALSVTESVESKSVSQKGQLEDPSALLEERDQLRNKLFKVQDKLAQLELELEQKRSLETNNGYLRAEVEALQKRKDSLEEATATNERLKIHLENAERELQALSKKTTEQENTIKGLETKLQKEAGERIAVAAKLKSQGSDLAKNEEETSEIKRLLSKTANEVKSCEQQLTSAESRLTRVSELERQVVEAKNALLLKDTEIRTMIEAKNSKMGFTPPAQQTASKKRSMTAQGLSNDTISRAKFSDPVVSSSDVVLAEVTAEKANLRSGPGVEHASLMQVQKGTHLVVETRKGAWLRVITPQGSRAYVMDDVVRVLNERDSAPQAPKRIDDDSVYVPFDATAAKNSPNDAVVDDVVKAFEKLRSGVNKNKRTVEE